SGAGGRAGSGEERLAADLLARIGRFGFAGRAAIADTPGAAWAAARFAGGERTVLASRTARATVEPLPVAALRLPADIVAGRAGRGRGRVGAGAAPPRAAGARRWGEGLAPRLDRARGGAGEPVSPLAPREARRSRLAFAEPIATPEDLARAMQRLVLDLCRAL